MIQEKEISSAVASSSSSSSSSLQLFNDDTYSQHLLFGFQLLREGSFLLDMPQSLSTAAQGFLVRFYSNKKSLQVYDVFTVSMSCFLIASKVLDYKLSLREIIFLFHFLHSHHKINQNFQFKFSHSIENNSEFDSKILYKKINRLELGSLDYNNWKQELIGMEKEVLTELGYHLFSTLEENNSFKFLESILKSLDLEEEDSSNIFRSSFEILNDFLYILPLYSYNPKTLAAAAIFQSIISSKKQLNIKSAWWNYFQINLQDLLIINEKYYQFYYQNQKNSYYVSSLCSVPYLE